MLLVACIFPIFCGIGLLFYNKNTNRKLRWGTALTQVLLTAGLFATAAYQNLGKPCELFSLSGQIEIVLKPDLAGLLFAQPENNPKDKTNADETITANIFFFIFIHLSQY